MTPLETSIIAEARSWLGTPYVHQASSKGAGADCLGLVRGVWRALYGQEPEAAPSYSMDWSEPRREERLWEAALRHLVPTETPAPGQVLLFRMRDSGVAKHLGLLSQAGPTPQFIHAYSGYGVVESALTPPWARRIVARFRFPERD